jgi:oligopeptidase B
MLEEPDPQFDLNVRATRSGGLLVLWSASRDTTEVWVVDTADPSSPPRSVGGRRRGVEYHAEHLVRPDGTDTLLLVTNDGAQEFRLMAAPAPRAADQDHTVWRGLLPEHPAERLERVDAFAGHVVLSLRTDGEHRLRVVPLDAVGRGAAEGGVSRPTRPAGFEARPPVVEPASGARRVETTFDIRPAFPAGSVALGVNQEYDATAVTVADQSYVHPPVWSDVDLATGQRTERHRREAPGHDPSTYVCGIRTFPAPDGTQVPATLVRHRDTPLDGTAPALLYGYGAYEDASDPEWDPALPSLLDRGVVFVHTHVRGGGEGGRQWWLDGRLDRKQNTFTDHVAVADGLAGASMAEPIAHGDRVETPALVDGTRLATRGLSAGGLVQAAVFTQRPERWRAVVAEVPFVDVVTTMFDPSVPLTAAEWDEWGDPRRKADFDWLLAYSPYDNLPPAGGRPDLLVTGAVNDPRVMVHEPAKWVAALRASDPAWSPRCAFRCELAAGSHSGPSGRFGHLAYEAEVLAWVLDRLGV